MERGVDFPWPPSRAEVAGGDSTGDHLRLGGASSPACGQCLLGAPAERVCVDVVCEIGEADVPTSALLKASKGTTATAQLVEQGLMCTSAFSCCVDEVDDGRIAR